MWFTAATSSQFGVVRTRARARAAHARARARSRPRPLAPAARTRFLCRRSARVRERCHALCLSPPPPAHRRRRAFQMLETYAERRGRACSDAVEGEAAAAAALPGTESACLPLFCVFDGRRVSPHDTLAEVRAPPHSATSRRALRPPRPPSGSGARAHRD